MLNLEMNICISLVVHFEAKSYEYYERDRPHRHSSQSQFAGTRVSRYLGHEVGAMVFSNS